MAQKFFQKKKFCYAACKDFPFEVLLLLLDPPGWRAVNKQHWQVVGLAQGGGQGGEGACSRQGPTRESRVFWWFKEFVMTFCGETASTHSSACTSLVSAAVELCLLGFSCRTSLPKVLQQQNTIKFMCLYSIALLRKDNIEKSAYSCSRHYFKART